MTKCMQRVRSTVGFELADHYYLRTYGVVPDGLLAACQTLRVLHETGDSLESARRRFVPLARAIFSVPVRREGQVRRSLGALSGLSASWDTDCRDGVRLRVASADCLIRKSNTEPVLRIVIEAKTAEMLERGRRDFSRLLSVALR